MRKLIYSLLAFLSRAILKKYKPKVIGITGSVGKSSAKEAIFAVVSQKYRSRRPEKNFNNEMGLPFTIIGVNSPGRNAVKWLLLFAKALWLLVVRQKYPEVLVLEYGIDRIGDMDHLIAIARPDIAVITSIGVSHYEFFQDAETIECEKGKIAESLLSSGTLVLNADNAVSSRQHSKTSARVVSYGSAAPADIYPQNLQEHVGDKIGTTCTVTVDDKDIVCDIKAVGGPHISAVMAALAVGKVLGIEADLLEKGISAYKPMPGRLNVFGGIKRSIIIDDTYNAAPDSMREALALLARMPHEHKLAVLGDMLELGAISDDAHREAGAHVAQIAPSRLIAIGSSGRIIAEGAKAAGYQEERIISFDTSDEAKRTVQEVLQPESAVLVKGSQGIRMEKIVLEIMADPMRASELLCRQDGRWLET